MRQTTKHVNIVDQDATVLMQDSIARYAKAIIENRAIPDVRDGLKPVHRRGLYTMYKSGILSTAKHKKMTTIAGRTLEYHPHNSGAIEDALALLSQDWRQNLTLLDIEGNNGSIAGDPHAAGRYIEGRTTPACDLMLTPLSEQVVKMVPTEDNEGVEPEVLPAPYPLLFINGSSGIAIGVSTNIPPHNPKELLTASIALNENAELSIEELLQFIPAPDFPTGGVLLEREGVLDTFKTGQGRFVIRAKAEIDGSSIVITELPYGVSTKSLNESMISQIIKHGLEKSIKDHRDESEGNQVRIVIEVKKGTDPEMILNFLYKYTQLQVNFNANQIAIHQGHPVLLGLKDYLEIFLDFRRDVLCQQLRYEWETKQKRGHIVAGLIRLISIADDVIALVKQSNGREEVIRNLKRAFKFTQEQATAIADLRLYRISSQDLDKLKKEYTQLENRLKEIAAIVSDKAKFTQYVSDDLAKTRAALGECPRRTSLDQSSSDVSVEVQDLVVAEKTVVVVRPQGIQRMSSSIYDNNKEEFGLDRIAVIPALTNQAILMFTKQGLLLQRMVADIESLTIRQEPEFLQKTVPSFLANDQIIYAYLVDDISTLDERLERIVSISRLGQVKVSPLSQACLSFNNKGYLGRTKVYNGLKNEGDHVEEVFILDNPDDLSQYTYQFTSGRRHKTLCLADVNEQGPNGSGVRAVKVKEDELLKVERLEVSESDK